MTRRGINDEKLEWGGTIRSRIGKTLFPPYRIGNESKDGKLYCMYVHAK